MILDIIDRQYSVLLYTLIGGSDCTQLSLGITAAWFTTTGEWQPSTTVDLQTSIQTRCGRPSATGWIQRTNMGR